MPQVDVEEIAVAMSRGAQAALGGHDVIETDQMNLLLKATAVVASTYCNSAGVPIDRFFDLMREYSIN